MRKILNKNFLFIPLVSIVIGFIFESCYRDDYSSQPENEEGLAPVYISLENLKNRFKPKPPITPNSISLSQTIGNYRIALEKFKGLHISLIKEDSSLYFMGVPLADGIFKEGDSLIFVTTDYGNIYFRSSQMPNLVFQEIVNLEYQEFWNSRDFRRQVDINPNLIRYTVKKVFMECPDRKKGYVLKWEEKSLKNPNCFKYF